MKKNKIEHTNEDQKLFRMIYPHMVRSFFLNGDITIDDLNDKVVLNKKLQELNKRSIYNVIIDHTSDLMTTAKTFRNANEVNKAKLFYATYFEHLLNGLIVNQCVKNRLDNKTINEIIRAVNIIGKLTWLTKLLKLPGIADNHKKVLLKLTDDRNAFVHYKHNPAPDKINHNDEEQITKELNEIERALTYFKRHISTIKFKGEKTKFEEALRKNRKTINT